MKAKEINGKSFMKKIAFVLCVAMAFSCFAACANTDDQKSSEASSKTVSGTYVGKNVSDEVVSWKGLSYAKPPVTGTSTDIALSNKHEPLTMDLINMMEHSPELKRLLEKSIEKARQVNPDPMKNPAQTLEAYYEYIDWTTTALPWKILPEAGEVYPTLYDQLDQSLDYFYFINDQPLEELQGLGLYRNTLMYVEPYRSWLCEYASQYGMFLNTEASWCDAYLEEVRSDPAFHMEELGEYEDSSNWKTFNQFFARYLSSPDQRPIAAKDDATVIVSPADSVPQGVWRIGEDSCLLDNDKVAVKSGVFSSVDVLLGDSAYKGAFAGGVMTHTFLDVNDYHRYHFPVGGEIKEVQIIPGDDAVGGVTIWDAESGRYVLQSEEPGWQMIETRACVIVDTGEYGLVAVLPIGMSQVSSVCLENTIVPGARVKKGDMLGCFLFGGSDIVMLFQSDAQFEATAPVNEEGSYRHILVGEEYGRFGGGQ